MNENEKKEHTLQTMWDSVESGLDSQRLKEMAFGILFEEVQAGFEKLFLPLHNLRTNGRHDLSHFDSFKFSVRIPYSELFDITQPANVSIEQQHNNAVSSFLVQGEKMVKERGVIGAISSQSQEGAVTPDEMWAVFQELSGRPVCLWAGRSVMYSMMRHPAWKHIFRIGDTGNAEGGVFGSAFGMLCCTDAFRYDTMQTLDNDEWLVFPVNCQTRVNWKWDELLHQKDCTIMSATLLIGEAKEEEEDEVSS